METTSIAGSRDWLASIQDIIISIPHHFFSEEKATPDFLLTQPERTETVETTQDDLFFAYVCETAGSATDLDPAFEAAAIEHWLNYGNG